MNIAQIAKMAGVSNAAVSRYFNNGYISEEKREAIRKVVEKTGYSPSVQAQTLRTKRTMMIGVVVPKMTSYAVGQVMDGLLQVLKESSYQTILAVTQNNPQTEVEYLHSFLERKVDGIVLLATVITEEHRKILKKSPIPIVVVGQRAEGYPCVYHDDYHAVYEITSYVLRIGRKSPAFIGVTQEDEAAGKLRLKGYQDALRNAGLADYAGRIKEAEFSFASGYKTTGELLDEMPEGEKLDSMICATDEIAAGAILQLQERGRRVPEEVIVTGLGGSVFALAFGKGYTTIRYEYEKSGRIAAEMLLTMLGGKKLQQTQVRLGYEMAMFGPDR